MNAVRITALAPLPSRERGGGEGGAAARAARKSCAKRCSIPPASYTETSSAVSSRQRISKIGGTCPLWNVYEAFAQPGRIVPQLARMPDGRAYLWVARTVARSGGG